MAPFAPCRFLRALGECLMYRSSPSLTMGNGQWARFALVPCCREANVLRYEGCFYAEDGYR